MPDDDDRPRDASSAADPSWPDIVIPDDISALQADIQAYRREQRLAIWRSRWDRLRRLRGAAPLLVVTSALVVAGLVATLLTVMAPTAGTSNTTALPLAHPTASPGTVGGLLPEAVLQGDTAHGPTDTSALRPAVLALVPTHCDCAALLGTVAQQADSVNLPLTVVVPSLSDSDAAALPNTLGYNTVEVLYDGNATLAATFQPHGVTAVLVQRNGTISAIQQGVTASTARRLDAPLQGFLLPPA